jgi:hypothetical protein
MTKTVKAWAEVRGGGSLVKVHMTRLMSRLNKQQLYPSSRVVRCTITYEVPEPAKKGKKR